MQSYGLFHPVSPSSRQGRPQWPLCGQAVYHQEQAAQIYRARSLRRSCILERSRRAVHHPAQPEKSRAESQEQTARGRQCATGEIQGPRPRDRRTLRDRRYRLDAEPVRGRLSEHLQAGKVQRLFHRPHRGTARDGAYR